MVTLVMKTVSELINARKSPIPDKIDKSKPHHLNLNMNYNGGKRGRKSDKERKQLSKGLKFKVERKISYLSFD